MTEGFSNPLVGGGGGLVYPSIHSPDYSAGPPLAGWSINKDGSASFADLELASPTLTLPSGFTGTIPITQSDATTYTAHTAAAVQFSKQWDIPAGDPAASVVYRFTIWGQGKQGTTADASSWSLNLGAVSIIALNIPGADWPISVTANFRLQVEVQCTAAGSGGNFNASGNWLLTNASTGAAIFAAALLDLTNTVDTLIDNKLELVWQWAATTGSPTISSYGSILERIS